ncbi:hypothetical protein QTP86_025563 [Hemibagrus guttatus]|nr:hypothetical protein QTP86_025563 [Hemibagrus guttatus]
MIVHEGDRDEQERLNDGVRLSVEETEPVQLQSSVRPFFSDYDTMWYTRDEEDEEHEADEVSQLVPVQQPPVHDDVKGSVEETAAAQLQSSVRPFFSNYDTYEPWHSERLGIPSHSASYQGIPKQRSVQPEFLCSV